jgi:repressor LexA
MSAHPDTALQRIKARARIHRALLCTVASTAARALADDPKLYIITVMSDLTPRQSEVLDLIRRAIVETGMPPTRAEIARELGFRSPNAAEEHLRALERKGCVQLLSGASRGIRLKDTMREQLGLPLVGRVAAGQPILAEEHIIDHLRIDPELFQPKPHYLLKVVGMSMKDAGIVDGDLVAVHRTPEVRNRQIIVARLENEVTVKRYRQEGSVVWLLPENEAFKPLRVDLREKELLIEGVVVGVLRLGAESASAARSRSR